ncbi:antitoxin VapB family protein [Halalkaliarchaeum sp. AArc-GB]|uniref:antitoxin VapB family protein n=1 Tax=unclassified Halalkaliarchaeum TaxID=2678344 RepID=UPI002859C369|nr:MULTISPECIES: antitoxin VapB family protein [unclassified Halalkaliarchaeum]MDR5672799.1 antitoxin VapB family protein [Halalkaliarchaeum sp. AArc-GB]
MPRPGARRRHPDRRAAERHAEHERRAVKEDTHDTLAALKGEDETFDDVLSRLIQDRCERVQAGAGLWEGTDAAEKAREKRWEMKR